MSEFRCWHYARRFLRAGFLAGPEGLLLIDIQVDPGEFFERAESLIPPGSVLSKERTPFELLIRELTEYLDGERKAFTTRVTPRLTPFANAVLEATARIPYGEVRSYGEVAALAGNPPAVRAAGSALAKNPFPILIPCHRVVKRGGLLGQFGGGVDLKRDLLALEGVNVKGESIV